MSKAELTDSEVAPIAAGAAAMKTASIDAVIERSEYERVRPRLSVTRLADYLRLNSKLVDDWLAYSRDKRTSAGWYFLAGSTWWVVGQVGPIAEQHFDDPSIACATFILNEFDCFVDRRGRASAAEPAPGR